MGNGGTSTPLRTYNATRHIELGMAIGTAAAAAALLALALPQDGAALPNYHGCVTPTSLKFDYCSTTLSHDERVA